MGQAARSNSQEYWRPANPDVVRLVEPTAARAACWRCGSDYPYAALFCHVCGSQRDPQVAPTRLTPVPTSNLDLDSFRQRMNLPIPCLVFFLLGITCMVGAALTGFVFKSDTLVDWQAVQLWRVEWLLGAAAAMLAGILLKK